MNESEYTFFGGDQKLPCFRESYGEQDCPKCGNTAYSHRYDAAHYPYLVFGYQYHCHTCSSYFEETKIIEDQEEYLLKIKATH